MLPYKVFLLTAQEATDYFAECQLSMKCLPTKYAASQLSTDREACFWWLRIPKHCVNSEGFSGSIRDVTSVDVLVRPAIRIDLEP